MKNILLILLLTASTIVSAQVSDNNLNTSNDDLKSKVSAIDKDFQFFKTNINEGTATLTGYFHYNLYKVIEEDKGNERRYYYWKGSLFSVFDSKMKKQLFFKGEFKNASEKMYDFYNQKANLYKSKFDNYLINPIFKVFQENNLLKLSDQKFSQNYLGSYDRVKFNNFKCIIPETTNYSVVSYSISYTGTGIDGELKVDGCTITEEVKNILELYKTFQLNIKIKDKNSGSIINLPSVRIKK